MQIHNRFISPLCFFLYSSISLVQLNCRKSTFFWRIRKSIKFSLKFFASLFLSLYSLILHALMQLYKNRCFFINLKSPFKDSLLLCKNSFRLLWSIFTHRIYFFLFRLFAKNWFFSQNIYTFTLSWVIVCFFLSVLSKIFHLHIQYRK